MPPKPKHTKDEIINAALKIASLNGLDNVKARDVGEYLCCSSRPIFTFFENMDELKKSVRAKAFELFHSYTNIADGYTPSFKMRGMQMIRFAKDEPHLFRMLFMTRGDEKPLDVYIKERMSGFEKDVDGIVSLYGVTRRDAERVFGQLWVHAYGICALCVAGACEITENDFARMLGESFESEMLFIKNGTRSLADRLPKPNFSDEAAAMSRPFTEIAEEEK